MNIIIPLWFYGFDSIMYFISSMVGFTLSYYFYQIYSINSRKRHMFLHLGFLILSLGLLSLSVTNTFSYLVFKNCHISCSLGLIDNVFSLEDFTYFMYFGLSIIAYFFFILAYKDEGSNTFNILIILFFGYLAFIILLLALIQHYMLWYFYSEYFHLIGLAMIVFVVFRTIINYNERRDLNSFLVMMSFILISLFHVFYLFSFTSEWMYVLSHLSLLAGFVSLLVMVSR